MWVADMDFISPEPVLRALHQRVEHGIFGYPSSLGNVPEDLPDLRQIVIDRMWALYNWRVDVEDILLLPGVVPGFNLACRALANPNEAVLVQTPVYHPMLHTAEYSGIQHQEMALTLSTDGSYSVDYQVFEDSITPHTRLFILCNPHNPIGKVFKAQELSRLAEICLRHDVVIVSDEIHSDLIFSPNHHVPTATLDPEVAQNTITLIAPSKTFNIPGLQCSIGIIQNRELRKRYQNAGRGILPWVNLMGMVAAIAAYQEGQEWLSQLLVYLEANLDFLNDYIKDHLPGIRMRPPEGTYLAWLDCRQAGIEGSPYQFFLENAKVAFNDGEIFGRGGEGFVRLNFGCPRDTLVEALRRVQRA
jgi:cystathionine beta-lyase